MRGIANSLQSLSVIALAQNEIVESKAHADECIVIYQKLGDQEGVADALGGAAALAIEGKRFHRATRLHSASEKLRQDIGAPLAPLQRQEVDHELAEIREALGDEDFEVAWREGYALTKEQSIALALEAPMIDSSQTP